LGHKEFKDVDHVYVEKKVHVPFLEEYKSNIDKMFGGIGFSALTDELVEIRSENSIVDCVYKCVLSDILFLGEEEVKNFIDNHFYGFINYVVEACSNKEMVLEIVCKYLDEFSSQCLVKEGYFYISENVFREHILASLGGCDISYNRVARTSGGEDIPNLSVLAALLYVGREEGLFREYKYDNYYYYVFIDVCTSYLKTQTNILEDCKSYLKERGFRD
jgi:hypothetical protein